MGLLRDTVLVAAATLVAGAGLMEVSDDGPFDRKGLVLAYIGTFLAGGLGYYALRRSEIIKSAEYQPDQTIEDYTGADLAKSSAIEGFEPFKYSFGPTTLGAEFKQPKASKKMSFVKNDETMRIFNEIKWRHGGLVKEDSHMRLSGGIVQKMYLYARPLAYPQPKFNRDLKPLRETHLIRIIGDEGILEPKASIKGPFETEGDLLRALDSFKPNKGVTRYADFLDEIQHKDNKVRWVPEDDFRGLDETEMVGLYSTDKYHYVMLKSNFYRPKKSTSGSSYYPYANVKDSCNFYWGVVADKETNTVIDVLFREPTEERKSRVSLKPLVNIPDPATYRQLFPSKYTNVGLSEDKSSDSYGFIDEFKMRRFKGFSADLLPNSEWKGWGLVGILFQRQPEKLHWRSYFPVLAFDGPVKSHVLEGAEYEFSIDPKSAKKDKNEMKERFFEYYLNYDRVPEVILEYTDMMEFSKGNDLKPRGFVMTHGRGSSSYQEAHFFDFNREVPNLIFKAKVKEKWKGVGEKHHYSYILEFTVPHEKAFNEFLKKQDLLLKPSAYMGALKVQYAASPETWYVGQNPKAGEELLTSFVKEFNENPKSIFRKAMSELIKPETKSAESAKPHSVTISRSTNPEKKLMAVFEDAEGNKIKTTHFGARGMSDYTKHKDKERMGRYNNRHKANENWNDPLSAGALSKWILWNKPSLSASFADFKKRFGLKGSLSVTKSAEGLEVNEAHEVMGALEEAGYETYIVGGAVRDSLMNNEPKDYDLGTSATPDEVKTVVEGMRGFRYITGPEGEVAKRALTSLILPPSGNVIEVTTFRSELYGSNRSEIMATPAKTFKEDSMRRDFTINALGMDREGNIIDYHGGKDDLKNGLIRAVGDPNERFREDPLRMIRAIRFAAKYGFRIDDGTYEAIVENRDLVKTLSSRRRRDEIGKALYYPEGFTMLMETGIIPVLMPEMRNLKDFQHNLEYHPEGNVYNHYVKAFRTWTRLPTRTELGGWALLFHDIAKPETADWKGQFHTYYGHDSVGSRVVKERYNNEDGPFEFSKKELEALSWTTRQHLQRFWEMKKPLRVAEMAESPSYPLLLEVVYGDSMGDHDEDMAERIQEIQTLKESVQRQRSKAGPRPKAFAPRVFKELGISEGPERSKIMARIDEMVSSGEASSYENALATLKGLETKEAKSAAQKSLDKWTREDWGTKSGKPSTQGEEATGERYLPRKAREALTDKEYARTSAKKRRDTAKGKQFSPQPDDVEEKVKKYRSETFEAIEGKGSKARFTDQPDPKIYRDPSLRQKARNTLLKGNKGGEEGEWSARKAQMAATKYRTMYENKYGVGKNPYFAESKRGLN